ncbi:MAG: hypothetical protein ACT4OQ_10120 [Chloroflexota bacterium]
MPRFRTAAGDLVIVESPATATTIERSPGPGVPVTAGYWHVAALGQLNARMLRDLEA